MPGVISKSALKHPFYILFLLMVVTAFLLSSCAAARSTQDFQDFGAPGSGASSAPQPSVEMPAISESGSFNVGNQGESAQQAVERLVIKNGNLTLVVNDPAVAMDHIAQLADELGGYVVSANLFKTRTEAGAEVPQATITIRVPAERFTESLARIEAESPQEALSKALTSQDITGEYTDLESRLRNLEATEAQLTEIMGSATKTEDVLAVYNQLTQVREQIEVIKGQMKYYEQSVALSSIQTELLANEAVQPLSIGGWQPVGVMRNALQALINGLKTILTVVIWLIIFFAPILVALFLFFVVPIWILVVLIRRRRSRHPKSIPPVAAQEDAPPSPPEQPVN